METLVELSSTINKKEETTPKLKYLAKINEHVRDKNITFEEEGHKYTIEGFEGSPTSVTTLIHHHFPTFDADVVIDKMMKSRNWINSPYYGKTKDQIKEEWKISGEIASNLGTLMHADIERFFNKEVILDESTIEFNHFKIFWEEFQKANPGFYPFRTEWLVYDEDQGIAGSIDFIAINDNGQIIIVDWKRSKEIKMSNNFEKGLGPFSHLDHCNYRHYSLQLNIYRHILETKYNKVVIGMYIAVFHPNNEHFLTYLIPKYDIASIWDSLTKLH